jgi:cell division protein FtsW (lipid II flippase)
MIHGIDEGVRPSSWPLGGQLRRSQMKSSQLNKPQFIIGIVLCVIAALIFLFVKADYATAGVITLLILGLAAMATSRRK